MTPSDVDIIGKVVGQLSVNFILLCVCVWSVRNYQLTLNALLTEKTDRYKRAERELDRLRGNKPDNDDVLEQSVS